MRELWPQFPLADVLEDVIDYRGKAPPKSESGVQLITARNVRPGSIDLSHKEFIPTAEYKSWMNRGLPLAGDILFTTEAPLGNACMYPTNGTFAVGQRIVTLRPKRDLMNAQFLCSFLQSEEGQNRISFRSTGSTAKGIKSRELVKILVPIPPLEHQRKIAEILLTWDSAIEVSERLLEQLRARQAALTSKLVFGHHIGGKRHAARSHWFSVPSDWSIVPIGEIARESSELNRNGTHAEVLSCSKYAGFVRSLDYFKKQIFSVDLSSYKRIRRGDFGFPSNHVEEGSIGLQDLVDIGLVSPIYTVFRFDHELVDPGFAYSALKTELYRHIFQTSTSASVDRRGSLRWKEFAKIPFPLPPILEQRKLQECLVAAQRHILREENRRDALKLQKRGLMQKLLTGQWRVKPESSDG